MAEQRVAVTGLGAVTPLGCGVQAFWDGLKSGRNGVAKVTHFDPTGFRSQLAGEVKDFDASAWLSAKEIDHTDRFTGFAIAAAAMAVRDAGLTAGTFDPCRAGVIIGSGIGGSSTIEDGHDRLRVRGPRSLSPFFVSKLMINTAACNVSIRHDLKGPLSAPSVACSTGANAIGDAFRIVQRGDADLMLAGSAEAAVTPLPYAGFCSSRSMTTNPCPETASRPFDRHRDGFVMGEGAGIVVLERYEHAVARQARIYAELVGYGNAADAYHVTAPQPDGDGMIRAMAAALRDAGIAPGAVGYINAHGTSTLLNDKAESAAIVTVFGRHAAALKVSSIKSMIGHLLAAAGAVEFVATVMSVYTGIVPPTIHYATPDPECPLDYVTHGAETLDLACAASNSFGFGGGNVCLVVKAVRAGKP
jgi:3-oxoacyl-[acyl-carrier-protein] synthase II